MAAKPVPSQGPQKEKNQSGCITCVILRTPETGGGGSKWIHKPYRLRDPKNEKGERKQCGYITLPSRGPQKGERNERGYTTLAVFGTTKEGKNSKWLHNPCRLGRPMLG